MSAAVACSCPPAAVRSRATVRPQQRRAAAPLAARRRPAAAACARRAAPAVAAAASSSSSSSSSATAVDVEAHMAVLRRACRAKDVPPEEVMAAMEALEAAHKAGAADLVQGVLPPLLRLRAGTACFRQPRQLRGRIAACHTGASDRRPGRPGAACCPPAWRTHGPPLPAHRQSTPVPVLRRARAGFPGALTGSWRLVFSAPSPIKAWQYIPVLEDAVIDAAAGGRAPLAAPGRAHALAWTASRACPRPATAPPAARRCFRQPANPPPMLRQSPWAWPLRWACSRPEGDCRGR